MTRPAAGKHKILVIGGGSAGLSLAARLRRAGEHDIAVVEPSGDHYYQPLWTLVGGRRAPLPITRRDEAGLIPDGVRWVHGHAAEIDPDGRTVTLASGSRIGYQALAVCPGIQLDWGELPGLPGTLGMRGVSSTTESTWHRRPGSSSATCVLARRCSACRPAR